MKRRLLFAFFIGGAVLCLGTALCPTARFRIVQQRLSPEKRQALAIYWRLQRAPANEATLTQEEERSGWQLNKLPETGFTLSKRLFLWSRLTLASPSASAYSWEYSPAPFAKEYLYLAT